MKNSYKKFGYYYDEVMAELEYDLWLEFIEPYLKKGNKILDLACGTGTFATMLKLSGYDSCGLDLSETIIEIANEKKKVNHLNIPFYVADMTNFKLNDKFDVITCFFDSVNFLSDKKQIDKMFNCVYSHLKDNGYFIFDIFSKELFKEYENNEIHKDYETFYLDWTTKKVSPTSLRHSIKIKELDEVFSESYYEYYYDIKDVLFKKFNVIKIAGDFNDDLEENDERILIVLQKK
ncbi:MAG: class I SAM-dependent methyltransferase [Acholeplasmatales bacterium]|nr:class I SAM-dependent methyltransferase [Acholeplasmatales bacterium]